MAHFSIKGTFLVTLCYYLIFPIRLLGQEIDSIIEIEAEPIDNGPFYTQLWFWVVLGIIFLIILILLLRGGSRKQRKEKEVDEEKVEKENKK